MTSPSLTSGVVLLSEPVNSPSTSPGSKVLTAAQSSQIKAKKRLVCPASISSLHLVGGNGIKKKKLGLPAGMIDPPVQPSQMAVVELVTEMKTSSSTDSGAAVVESTAKPLPFKDPNFVHSGIGGAAAGKKNRTWKNLKQILTTERALPWKLSDPNSLCNPDHQGTASSTVTTYWLRPCDGAEGFHYNIDAPPSFKPAKKYSDISGLPANYTDPQTKLRFTSSEEFSYIRLLPTDVVTGYLALRKASCIVP